MERSDLLAPGLWLMTVAPAVVTGRAFMDLLDVSEPSFYWTFFAAGGTLSGIGMILTGIATYDRAPFAWVVSGAIVALLGHNVVGALPGDVALLGPALVHVGTGLLLWPWRRLGLAAGAVAGLGAVLRWQADAANLLLALGALGLLVLLAHTALRGHANGTPDTATAPDPA